MKTPMPHTRHALALALCAALAAPVASAQLVERGRQATPPPKAERADAPPVDRGLDRAMERAADQSAVEDAMERVETAQSRDPRDRDLNDDIDDEDGNPPAHSRAATDDTWATLDLDGDARLSAEEAADDAALSTAFVQVDVDGDGFVSDAEYRDYAQGRHVVDASATGAVHAAGHSAVAVRATWADLDADADGRISLDEATLDGGFEGAFELIDTDGDGFASEAEYRAYAKARMEPDAP